MLLRLPNTCQCMCDQEVMILKNKFNLTKKSFVKVLADFFGLHIGEILVKKTTLFGLTHKHS
jgi:hypothetical protein